MLEKPFCFFVNHQGKGHVGLPDRKYDIMRNTEKNSIKRIEFKKGINKRINGEKTHTFHQWKIEQYGFPVLDFRCNQS